LKEKYYKIKIELLKEERIEIYKKKVLKRETILKNCHYSKPLPGPPPPPISFKGSAKLFVIKDNLSKLMWKWKEEFNDGNIL